MGTCAPIKDNSVLTAVSLLMKLPPMLKLDSRAQLNKSELTSIHQYLSLVLKRLAEAKGKINDSVILADILNATQTIDYILEDETFQQTDLQAKELIGAKVLDALDRMYKSSAEYYMKDYCFEYSPRMSNLLITIINECIDRHGMTFGKEIPKY